MMTDHCVIRSDARIDDVRFAGVYLEEAYAAMHRLLGGDPSDIRFSIRIFRSWKEFHGYAVACGVPSAESFYNPKTLEVVVYREDGQPRKRLAMALLHEFTHIYIHRVFGKTGPLWLTEGLAEYFGHHDTSTGRLRVGAVSVRLVLLLKQDLGSGHWLPLGELMKFDREKFYGFRSAGAYSQSWLLVHALIKRGPDTIRACLKAKEARDVLPGIAALEKAMRKHLKGLK